MQVAGSAIKRTGATSLSEGMRMKAVGLHMFPGYPDVAASPSSYLICKKPFISLTAHAKINSAKSSGCFLHSNYYFLYCIISQQFTLYKLIKALAILF